MIYFNAWGIATLICCVFTLLILGFLLSIRNKSRNSLILVGFFIGGFVLDFGFLWSAVLPEPMGAWHRFLTVAGVFFPVTLMIAFAYNFPRLMYPREAIVAVTFFALLALGLSVHFYYQALQTQPEFSFNGNIFNYFEAPGKPLGRYVSYGIVLCLLWFQVVMIRKILVFKGEERRAQIQLLIAMTVPTLGPGIANMLFQRGAISHDTFQQAFVLTTLTGYFAITIVFINNTVERTSFMTKIVGISIMTILLVVQALFTVVNYDFEDKFDQMRALEARTYLLPGSPVPENAEYVFARTGDGPIEVVYNAREHDFDLDAVADTFGLPSADATPDRYERQLAPNSDQLYFGYLIEDSSTGRQYEVGFPYLVYRAYIHEFASHVAMILVVLVLMILVLYPLFFSRTLVRPLNKLLEGVGEVNVGNLEVRIPVLVQDEIGYLSESFNRMVRSILEARDKLQDYADNLEEKVADRTREVQEKLQEIEGLKVQQDGDYYLTALIGKPLAVDWNKSGTVATEFFMEQKKKFSFRERESELGGDICIAGNLRFATRDGAPARYTVFCNGDAMGKSMQGAGGAIVLGTAMNNIMSRSARNDRVIEVRPEEWLERTYRDLDDTFRTFDGVMMASVVLGLVNDVTGEMYYFNAEHPWTVLYRDGRARFIETELNLRKLGSLSEYDFQVHMFQLQKGDVLFIGSDGRDDIDISKDASVRMINEDETVFLDTVQEAGGKMERTVELIRAGGGLTDDLSLIRVEFSGAGRSDVPASTEIMPLSAAGSGVDLSGPNAPEGLARSTASSTTLEGLQRQSQELFERKEYAAAAELMVEILDLRPDVAEVWFNLSLCYKHLKRIDAAAHAGEKLFNLQPDRVANLINLADNYRLLGQFAEAREYLTRALKLSPDNANGRKLDELLKAKGA